MEVDISQLFVAGSLTNNKMVKETEFSLVELGQKKSAIEVTMSRLATSGGLLLEGLPDVIS